MSIVKLVTPEEQRIKEIMRNPEKKQEALDLISARIASFETALQDPQSMTHFAFSKSPKQDIIYSWALCLEARHELINDPEDITEISTIIKMRFEKLGFDKNYDYVHKVLPAKYKNRDKQHALDLLEEELRRNNSPENSSPWREMNYEELRYYTHIFKHIEIMEEFAEHFKNSPNEIPQEELKEFNRLNEALHNSLRHFIDARTRVTREQFHAFCKSFVTSKNSAFSNYVQYIKDFGKLTGKQATKLLSGRTTTVPELYDPRNINEARHANFFGNPCPECGSWRVEARYNSEVKDDQLYCYACSKWSILKRYKLLSRII